MTMKAETEAGGRVITILWLNRIIKKGGKTGWEKV